MIEEKRIDSVHYWDYATMELRCPKCNEFVTENSVCKFVACHNCKIRFLTRTE